MLAVLIPFVIPLNKMFFGGFIRNYVNHLDKKHPNKLLKILIHTLQSRDYQGNLEGKRRQNGDEQRQARGIAALQISNTTINQLFRPYVTKC